MLGAGYIYYFLECDIDGFYAGGYADFIYVDAYEEFPDASYPG